MAPSTAPPAADICFGISKKTGRRCANKSKSAEPGCLPTCHQHRDQHLRAGRCKKTVDPKSGKRCLRLFHYHPPPPHFELCPDHAAEPDDPCYFLRLPTELRMEIYRHIRPPGTIINSGSLGWVALREAQDFLPLLLVSKQIGSEARDHLYGSTIFHMDIGHSGATIRKRYLYCPRSAEESTNADPVRELSKGHDLRQQLDFSLVKNYDLEIIVQNQSFLEGWSEEVEIYDIRDTIRAIMPFLARARQLHRLNIRVVFCGFAHKWAVPDVLSNFKTITEPLMSLRSVTRPSVDPVLDGEAYGIFPPGDPITCGYNIKRKLLDCLNDDFIDYKKQFERTVSSNSPLPEKTAISRMFTEFKKVYLTCATHLSMPRGSDDYLHRARVARETNDMKAFCETQDALQAQWIAYYEAKCWDMMRVNLLFNSMLRPTNGFGHAAMASPESVTQAGWSMNAQSRFTPPEDHCGVDNGSQTLGLPSPSAPFHPVSLLMSPTSYLS